jgi:hypothetical protein
MKSFYSGLETGSPINLVYGPGVLIYQHIGVGRSENQHCIAGLAALTDPLETTPSSISNLSHV